jgi:hypothetical protein
MSFVKIKFEQSLLELVRQQASVSIVFWERKRRVGSSTWNTISKLAADAGARLEDLTSRNAAYNWPLLSSALSSSPSTSLPSPDNTTSVVHTGGGAYCML